MSNKCYQVAVRKQLTVYVYAESEECAEAIVNEAIDNWDNNLTDAFDDEELYVSESQTEECAFIPGDGFFVLNPEAAEEGGDNE